jgi:RNA recognition motif-containing protein
MAYAAKEAKEAVDARSIYVGSVDYSSTDDELKEHFKGCGTINRVTIRKDKVTGKPMGYAHCSTLNCRFCSDLYSSHSSSHTLHSSVFFFIHCVVLCIHLSPVCTG